MATNFNKTVSGWDKGDFDYSGSVNGSDFVLLADNFNQYASQSAVAASDIEALDAFAAANGLMADIPEPAAGVMVMAVMFAGLSIGRRESHDDESDCEQKSHCETHGDHRKDRGS
jgi:hypothetical protein